MIKLYESVIEDINMTERVWKLTMYMTDKQWEELSKWSAPIGSKRNIPWLYLEHEPSPEGEYEKKKEELEMSIPEKVIYTTE